jgi:SAM-dependent methyltransferase
MDSKQRFSSRVENYIKYRPGYPAGVLETLRDECGLAAGNFVADVGSGTGLLARIFLDFGCHVFGVEPNPEMRAAGERLLAHYRLFTSLSGSAESTGLPTASMDLVTAGQAFHWFNPVQAREEFRRILKPAGWVALVWNERRMDTTPFLRAYEHLLQTFASDYNQVSHRNVEENPHTIPVFFGGDYRVARFDNVQMFQFEGVRGRLESSSYVPEPGHPDYEPMLVELRDIFDRYQQDGMVSFEYDTRMFYGRLAETPET